MLGWLDLGQIAWNLDGPIRANHFRVPELNPLSANPVSGALKIANRRFQAIRANRSNVMKTVFFLRVNSRESPRFALRIAGPSKPFSFSCCLLEIIFAELMSVMVEVINYVEIILKLF